MIRRLTEGLIPKTLVVLAALALAGAIFAISANSARADTTFVVNDKFDSSDEDLTDNACDVAVLITGDQCTLRAAIEQANATSGADTINFNIPEDPSIPGDEVRTIKPVSLLPLISEAVTINGYTQGDATSTTTDDAKPNTLAIGNNAVLKIELNGSEAGSGVIGLVITAANSTVKGLVINRWSSNGVGISGTGATGNKIEGNFIGTDASGTQDLGSNGDGVTIFEAPNNTVGGTVAGTRNTISGNELHGVFIYGTGATGNKVEGNFIGTKKDGTGSLGNGGNGAAITTPNNTVGGTVAGARNMISGNSNGVVISGTGATGNRVLSNSIFSNLWLGIDLNNDGATANDDKDPDVGPNNLQNFPVLTSAKSSRKGTTVKGTLNSTAGTTFTLQFFSGPAMDLEGKKFLGQTSVTTDASGNASFTFKAKKKAAGEATATAADPNGNTSEFSAAKKVVRRR